MRVTKNHLQAAVDKNIITASQAEALLNFLRTQPSVGPSFDFTHVLYYFGGLIAIGAMSLFMTLGWEAFGGWGIFAIALLYAGIGLTLAGRFQVNNLAVPSGICATFVVALSPLAIYGLQRALGWWPDDTAYRNYHYYIQWHWIFMELGTLAVGAVMVYRYRYPFLLMPVAVTLWYMSMDIAAMIAGGTPDFELRTLVSMYFGLLMTLGAFWVDLRARKSGDYAFWLYLFGVITFWGGMTSQHSANELPKLLYFLVNLLMIGLGVVLVRRVFVVFGGIGSCFYLGHLASTLFQDSWLFPISLTVIGLFIIYLGVLWQRNEHLITAVVRGHLPPPLQEILTEKRF